MSKHLLGGIAIVIFSVTVILPAGKAAAEPVTVCVEDFRNLDEDAGNAWIGHLVSDRVRTNIRTLPVLRVVSPNRLDDARDHGQSFEATQHQQEVSSDKACAVSDYTIRGEYNTDGDRVTVNAACISNREGRPVGDASFNSSFLDLYSRVDDFSISVTRSLGIELTGEQEKRLRRLPSSSLDAMKLYGEALSYSPTSSKRRDALLKAISRDRTYTDAFSQLGLHYYATGRLFDARESFEKLAEIQADYPNVRYNLGLTLRSLKDYPGAIRMYRRALSLRADDPDIWNNLGVAYYYNGMPDQASESFERALRINPNDTNARRNLDALKRDRAAASTPDTEAASITDALREHVELGAGFYASGDYWQAKQEFEKALEIDPDNFKANNNIALVYLKLGERERAKAHFERALDSDPTAIDVRESLSRLEEELELARAKKQAMVNPALQVRALCATGRVHLSRRAYGEARDTFLRAVEVAPNDIEALNGLGTAYFGLRDFRNAHEQFSRVIDLEPDNEIAKQRLSETEFIVSAVGSEGTADVPIELSLAPEVEARARYIHGNELYEQGKYEDALSEYLRGLDLNPTSIELLNNIGTVYFRLNRYDEARTALKKARLLDPTNEMVANNLDALALTVTAEKDIELNQIDVIAPTDDVLPDEKAVALPEESDEISEIEPGDSGVDVVEEKQPEAVEHTAESYFRLAVAEEDRGNLPAALAYYKESLRLDPENVEAHYNLGNVYLRIDEADLAVRSYRRAINVSPAFAAAYNNLGVAYHALGRHDEAAGAWRRACEINPKLKSAQQNLLDFGNREANTPGISDEKATTGAARKGATGMVRVPAGEFLMGSPPGEGGPDESPQHRVVLDDFYMDACEVTNARFGEFLDIMGNREEGGATWLSMDERDSLIRHIDGKYVPLQGFEDHPVVGVTWYGARAYAKWAQKRLPTEAEWEYACRAGTTGKYNSGDKITRDYANQAGTGGRDIWKATAPVGSFSPNAWGLYDMHGNAWEWCADWYDGGYYENSPEMNPQGPSSGGSRTVRGGSWFQGTSNALRSAYRNYHSPASAAFHIGFRCVRDSEQ